MVSFERRDPDGNLSAGKSIFDMISGVSGHTYRRRSGS